MEARQLSSSVRPERIWVRAGTCSPSNTTGSTKTVGSLSSSDDASMNPAMFSTKNPFTTQDFDRSGSSAFTMFSRYTAFRGVCKAVLYVNLTSAAVPALIGLVTVFHVSSFLQFLFAIAWLLGAAFLVVLSYAAYQAMVMFADMADNSFDATTSIKQMEAKLHALGSRIGDESAS